MAETLTYDPATDTTTVGDNLTPEEQESLQVGEELETQQEGLLAGKYKNAEELEKAYGELQKKLGEQEAESKGETVEETVEPEAEAEPSPQVTLITDASVEYAEKGEISDETLAKFSEISSKDLVQAYVEAQKNAPEQQTQVADLTDAEVNSIHNSIGGEQSYADVITWSTDNLGKETMDAFDSLVKMGNAKAIELAVSGMKSQYDDANGYEGRMLSGKSPKTSGDIYRSQPELVAAMNDPRYDTDPAYRQDVIAKLERSDNLQF